MVKSGLMNDCARVKEGALSMIPDQREVLGSRWLAPESDGECSKNLQKNISVTHSCFCWPLDMGVEEIKWAEVIALP